MQHSKWPSSPCTWNAYVEAGKDLAERRERLAMVPDNMRQSVQAHVACYFRLKAAKTKAKK